MTALPNNPARASTPSSTLRRSAVLFTSKTFSLEYVLSESVPAAPN